MKKVFLFFLLTGFVVNAQMNINYSAYQDSLIKQLNFFPQEKIHLHTDRTMYVPGERIWFKAYVVDALTNQHPTFSQYVYVELINSSETLVHRVMVKSDHNGLFHGHIFLSEIIPEGDYTLRAYTRYMENLGDDFFFNKSIWIGSLKPEPKQVNRKPQLNYDVYFFPEGGNLPEGVVSRVAFKALNQQGASETITGRIVDKEGRVIIPEVHTLFAGMGSFYFYPEVGNEYFLVCKNSNGKEKRFKLPAVKRGRTLVSDFRNDRHYFQIKQTPEMPQIPLYLLLHSKGELLYFAQWDQRSEFISIPKNQLPSGVIQAVLFDEHKNPICERLIFNKNEDQTNLAFQTDQPFYAQRERVISEIHITDSEGNPLSGNVSIAVTDDQDIAIDTLNTIVSSLLLSSELKGYIESPGYYLQNSMEAENALDHLMMIHGWRRYEIQEAVKGNYSHPKIEFETAKELFGSIKTPLLGRPVPNGEILIFVSDGSWGIIETDSAGLFRFPLNYPDSTKFFLQARNQKGRQAVELVLKQESFPKLIHAPVSASLLPLKDISKTDLSADFIKKAEQRALYDEDLRVIHLEEVVVTARRIEKKDEIRLQYWMNLSSDKTIYREEIEKRKPNNVYQILRGLAGVVVKSDGTISMRGIDSPLIIIDGMIKQTDSDVSLTELVSIHDVESIDIFKGPSAAIFGSRGGAGAISITTRLGGNYSDSSENTANIANYFPLGYQKPVEFYAPTYDTPQSKNSGNPDYRTTLYWKPDLIVSDDGTVTFEFYTSDFSTTCSVVIEGLSNNGKIIRKVETIEVR